MKHQSPCCNYPLEFRFGEECLTGCWCTKCGNQIRIIADLRPINWGRIIGFSVVAIVGFVAGALWFDWILN